MSSCFSILWCSCLQSYIFKKEKKIISSSLVRVHTCLFATGISSLFSTLWISFLQSPKKKFAVLICASASNDGGNDEELGKSNCLRGPAFPRGKTEFLFLGGDIFDNQIWEPQTTAIVRTTTIKKKFSRINGVLRFPDWEKTVRLINYMTGTFMKIKLKVVTTSIIELRETEKLILKE